MRYSISGGTERDGGGRATIWNPYRPRPEHELALRACFHRAEWLADSARQTVDETCSRLGGRFRRAAVSLCPVVTPEDEPEE